MNDQKNNQILVACLMGIVSGVSFGLICAMQDGGGWHKAIVTGIPCGLAMMLFSVVRSYKLSRWFWVGVLAIGLGVRVCLGKLFGM
jgi:hypothetical protein